ncbi:MAG: hypothetical protein EOO24_29720 [Comamonadaceae bacterium]|nr:MAG: hypothetical protein EOO24_29720 [Comamonadaceae bacterium]
MHNHRFIAAAMAAFVWSAAPTVSAAPSVLKEEPAKGVLRVGEVVYVDDGSCPAGELKKIVGGSQQAGRRRQAECVKRPEGM